jgi:hypothetical protein
METLFSEVIGIKKEEHSRCQIQSRKEVKCVHFQLPKIISKCAAKKEIPQEESCGSSA